MLYFVYTSLASKCVWMRQMFHHLFGCIWTHPGRYSRPDAPQLDQPHTTHPNADEAKARPDACKQAMKHLMRPNASTNRI